MERYIGKMKVSPLGFGCMGITHASGKPLPKKEGVRVIEEALDAGYTMFDTAECYTGIDEEGKITYNEDVVGEALLGKRDKVILASKFGVIHKGDHLEMDSRPSSIRKAIEGSLARLKTDYLDIYYQHRIDPNVAAEEVAETMRELIKEGKIRAWGISEVNEDYLRRAHAVCPVTVIQNRYSMLARWYEDLFPVVEELGIAFVAFSPLAHGFLSNRYDGQSQFEKGVDYRSTMPQYSQDGFAKTQSLRNYLACLAQEKNCSEAMLSLAWVLHQKPYLIPIPGSRKKERIIENFNSCFVTLSKEELDTINTLLQEDFPVFGGHK